MRKSWKLISAFTFIVLLVGVIITYIYKSWFLENAFKGTLPAWLNNFVNLIYPRFEAERNRLPFEFFDEKLDQLVIRFLIVLLITGLFVAGIYNSEKFRNRVYNLTDQNTSYDNINGLRVVFYLFLIIISRNVYEDLRALENLSAFYKPIWLLRLVNLSFPTKQLSFVIYSLIFLSAFLVIFSIRPVFFSVLAAAGFILYQAFLYSFEKIDHGYATFTYALMIMPFLLMEREKAKKLKLEYFRSWSLRLVWIVISAAYFLSGLEKLLISGAGWISPDTFKTYLYLHPTKAGMYVAKNTFLIYLLPILAMVFQLCFPVILFIPKMKWVILAAGILFHTLTVVLFGISSFENPWVMAYVFFIDWSKPGRYLRPLPEYFKK